MLDIDTKKIKEFQMDMLAFFDREHKEIGKAIDEKKVLDDELKEQILAAVSYTHLNYYLMVTPLFRLDMQDFMRCVYVCLANHIPIPQQDHLQCR